MRLIASTAALAATVGIIHAEVGDERWSRQFYDPSFGTVNALAFDTNGHLVCGGTFNQVAGVAGTANLARWDGTNWHSMGGGLPGAVVWAVLPIGNQLIVGGAFTSVAGQAITNLARWDGTNWHGVGGGVSGASVRALALHEGDLAVAGEFNQAGGQNAGNIAVWDGTTWNVLGGGVQGTFARVRALLSVGGHLYVGGRFASAGSVNATNVARLSGAEWHSLGAGAENGTDNTVTALVADENGAIYVGGSFTKAGTATVNHLAAWDGQSWSGLGNIANAGPSSVNGLYYSPTGGLYVTGNFNQVSNVQAVGVARWSGGAWHALPAPVRHPASTIAGYGARVVFFARLWNNVMVHLQSQDQGLVEFDGERATILGASVNRQVNTVVSTGEKALVSGFFENYDGNCCRTMVAQWDSIAWSNLGNGVVVPYLDTSSYIRAFLPVSNVVYAGGVTAAGNQVLLLTNNAWASIGVPPPGTPLALAWFQGALHCGHSSGISRWNGVEWSDVGEGVNGAVYALAVADGQLYAGGLFSNAGSTTANNIGRWDGTNWHAMGTGANGLVYSLVAWQSRIYAGGDFTEAGGIPAPRVALWEGGIWSAVGDGFHDGIGAQGTVTDSLTRVYAVKVLQDGRLFAAGNFTRSGTNVTRFVARWDGVSWASLGSGLNNVVLSMDLDEHNLFLGGTFTVAGGGESIGFARWQIPMPLKLEIERSGNDSTLTLGVSGEAATPFVLEKTANFQQWSSVATNAISGSRTRVVIERGGNDASFYRVRRVD